MIQPLKSPQLDSDLPSDGNGIRFSWIHSEEFPVVFYGVEFEKLPPPFKFKRKFYPHFIQHQTAGCACYQRHLYGMLFKPTDQSGKLAETLLGKYYGSGIGQGGAFLDDLVVYRRILNNYGLDCNESFNALSEGFYPVDVRPEFFQTLTGQEYQSLESLLTWNRGLREWEKYVFQDRVLAILVENSD